MIIRIIVFISLVVLTGGAWATTSNHVKDIRGAGPVKVLRTTEMDMDVSMGHFPDRYNINKFGHNPDVDAAEDIWHGGGNYTGFPLTDVEKIEVVSSDVNDTSAGSGCRTVTIHGLDTNYDRQSETVSLAGTTPVDTVNTYRRSWRALCATAGTSLTNVGTITVRHTTTTANVFGILEIGVGGTQNSMYTVPLGFSCFIRSYGLTMSDNTANQAELAIWIRTPGGAERLVNHFHVSTVYGTHVKPPGADAIPEKTDIKMRVTSIVNANGYINFTGALMCAKDEQE